MNTPLTTDHARQSWIIAGLAVTVVLVSSCSSSKTAAGGGSSSAAPATASSASSTAASTPSASGSSPAASASAAGNSAIDVLAKAMAPRSTWNGPTSAPKPLTGKTIGIVPCGLAIEGCAREANGAAEAAKTLGWTPIVVDGLGTPQGAQQAIDSLLNRHVDGIIIPSVNAGDVGSQLARAKAEKVPVIATFASDPTSAGGTGVVNIDDLQAGRALAAYVSVNGAGNVVLFTQNQAPAVAARAAGFKAGLAEFGNVAKISDEQSLANTQIGAPEQQLMSAILQRRAKGQIQWVFAGFDFMLSPLITVAQQAGRTEIKGLSFDGNKQNLEQLRNGETQNALIGYPLEWAGWGAIDDLNRVLQGQPLVPQGVDFRLLTKDNLPPAGQSYTGDLDYKKHYLSIWGK